MSSSIPSPSLTVSCAEIIAQPEGDMLPHSASWQSADNDEDEKEGAYGIAIEKWTRSEIVRSETQRIGTRCDVQLRDVYMQSSNLRSVFASSLSHQVPCL